jgi:hypothetical protein
MDQETHTYVVQQNQYTVTKKGEVKQVGGDWYNLYTSAGEVRVPGDIIKKLVRRGYTAQAIEAEGQKYNDTFKLSGAVILKRGTPFGDTTVYVEDIDDGRKFDKEDEELVEELTELSRSIEEQLNDLSDTQERLRTVGKKILSKKKPKKK